MGPEQHKKINNEEEDQPIDRIIELLDAVEMLPLEQKLKLAPFIPPVLDHEEMMLRGRKILISTVDGLRPALDALKSELIATKEELAAYKQELEDRKDRGF